MKTLLVDGNDATRPSLAERVRSCGYEVTPCADSRSALWAYSQDAHRLILLDRSMPGGDMDGGDIDGGDIDGLELCRRLRSLPTGDRTVILVMTDRDQPADLRAILDAGADDYLIQPIDVQILPIRLAIAEREVTQRDLRREAKDQLRQSLERLDLATRGTNDGLWDARATEEDWRDPNNEVWYSPRFKQLLGYHDDEFENLFGSWIAQLHPEDLDAQMQSLEDHLERQVPYDVIYRMQTKSGQYRWFRGIGQAHWDAQGKPHRMTGSLRDVTEKIEIEQALRTSEAKWRSFVENVPDIIITADRNGIIQFINRVLPGFQIEDVIGSSLYDYVPEDEHERVRKTFMQVIETQKSADFEITGPSSHGTIAWYSARVGPLVQGGKVMGITMITSDVTSKRHILQTLRSEQKLLKQLLDLHERDRSVIAYEIHDGLVQHMTGAMMHMDAYRQAVDRDPPRAENEFVRAMQLMREAVDEGRRLINGVRPPVLDEMGIVVAIEHLVNETRASIPKIRFSHRASFDRLAKPLETAIFRIVQEALTNVRRHSGAKTARVELTELGSHVRIIIRDWGCGFEVNRVQEERFGLQGMRERTRLMGGVIAIDSSPGKGTQIVVDLPVYAGDGRAI